MKSPESLRKKPKQGRSKELVDAIFQATVRILPEVGSENVTTKKIAEVAGVSIGSLYQYFPNKETLLAAVMDASSSVINAALNKRFRQMASMEIDEAIQFAVDGGFELMLNDRKKIREVYRQVSELGRVNSMFVYRRVAVETLSSELHRRYPNIPPKQCQLIAFVCINAQMGIIITMLYDESQEWSREELSRELGDMFKSYVKKKVEQA